MQDMGTVLIVDDNPNTLQVLVALLAAAGYKVRPALSGEIALRSVALGIPDLILLDVRMPGMDGYETCRRLRSHASSRDIPVIFISTMADTEDKLAGFGAGGVDYVAKPFQAEEVLARVKTHIALYRMQLHLEGMVKERTQDLARSEARYRILFEDCPLAVMVYDVQSWCILDYNIACSRFLGYDEGELLGVCVGTVALPEQRLALQAMTRSVSAHSEEAVCTGMLHFQHTDGHVLETEGIVKRIEYSGQQAHILMLQDVSERRHAEERLQRVSKEYQRELEQVVHYDVLTGLPNRELLVQRMRQGMKQAQLTGCWMTVCYLDIDDFKPVNDAHGTRAGDHLLINVAQCLRGCLSGGDTLARIGGDEFVLLLLGPKSDEALDALLLVTKERLAAPFSADDWSVSVSVSIGLCVYPLDDADPDILLRHAAQAMVQAKQSGKGKVRRFDPDSDKRVRTHRESVGQMRQALLHQEFVLYYQPKVDVVRGVVIGVEALIRWNHPQRGLLPPGVFLPQIEDDPFMLELGDWVLAEALAQMSRWRSAGLDLVVSVNIAAQQLARPDFIERLRDLLYVYPASEQHYLELEVLETSALEDIGKVDQIIASCRELGVGFSLDDFGTGYSSLTYLRKLSADTLKIDQSFVRDMLEDSGDQAIVSGVIGLALAFKRRVIAEGVESVAHGRALRDLGCTLLQGYGIARPMPAQDVPNWVQQWPDAAWLELMQGG
jgi:diguanylate cyclase (GGDEF)-like protein/PAS domain S-box-containing protein